MFITFYSGGQLRDFVGAVWTVPQVSRNLSIVNVIENLKGYNHFTCIIIKCGVLLILCETLYE